MAISLNEIGNLGHLGNQMFQYASLQGIANNRNFDWKIPPRSEFGTRYAIKSNIFNLFYLDLDIESHTEITDYPSVLETGNGFNRDLFNFCPDNTNLSGYFQAYQYFEKIEGKIKRDFKFISDPFERVVKKNTLSIHVRRGDYLGITGHLPVLGLEYYSYALDSVGSFDQAIVFSDDIEWCRSQEIFNGFEFSKADIYSDFKLMTQCDKHIIANSTFSWWGAWLSHSNSVVCPYEWFGPALSTYTVEGYIVPGWRAI